VKVLHNLREGGRGGRGRGQAAKAQPFPKVGWEGGREGGRRRKAAHTTHTLLAYCECMIANTHTETDRQ